jgi:hypothetical protein
MLRSAIGLSYLITSGKTHLLGAKAEAEATRAATIRTCFIMVEILM